MRRLLDYLQCPECHRPLFVKHEGTFPLHDWGMLVIRMRVSCSNCWWYKAYDVEGDVRDYTKESLLYYAHHVITQNHADPIGLLGSLDDE